MKTKSRGQPGKQCALQCVLQCALQRVLQLCERHEVT